MSKAYYRPIIASDSSGGVPLAGGWAQFEEVEVLRRGTASQRIPADTIPNEVLTRLTRVRQPIAGLSLGRPNLMGILNVTPDSFSDGGLFLDAEAALAQARRMLEDGADILDIGGESTRPGAENVSIEDEISRTVPVIEALRRSDQSAPVSIDTRKSAVAEAALEAGAGLINDVAALTFDAGLGPLAAKRDVPVCLMHAQGTPKTMQQDPIYDDVLLDVYDFLEERVITAEKHGIFRSRILVDPGIGFGKTVAHNLALLRGLSLFHGLGCAILLGASRKRFIGALTGADLASDRVFGSVAVALEGVRQGVQVLRVHDVKETKQALLMWQALNGQEAQT